MERDDINDFSLFEGTRTYLNEQIALLKLETIEKLTLIVQAILLILLAVILIGGALFYLSLGFIWWSKDAFGGFLPGIFIVCGSYLLLLLLIFIFRKSWIINPLVRVFSKIFFSPNNHPTDNE